jgi:hypothetical protein
MKKVKKTFKFSLRTKSPTPHILAEELVDMTVSENFTSNHPRFQVKMMELVEEMMKRYVKVEVYEVDGDYELEPLKSL